MRKILATFMSLIVILSAIVHVSAKAEELLEDVVIVSTNDEDTDIDADENAEVFEDEVWVGGVQVTDENKDDVLGDGGSVKYDPETDTLTLTDATIANEAGHGIYACGINLTINGIDTEAAGNNSISGKSTSESGIDEEGYEYTETYPGCGIYVEGDGYGENGGIIINGVLGDITAEEGGGISAFINITISGTVGNITCTGGIDGGIESDFGSIIIEKDGVIGDINSLDYDGIATGANVVIDGKVGNILGGGYAGIHATGGDVTISGSVESIVGYSGGIEAYQDFGWNIDGSEVYSGGNVTISGTVGKISGGMVGISADEELNITGSAEITATDEEIADKSALSIGGNIVFPDGLIIEPAEYKIESILAATYKDESGEVEVWNNTICDSEGTPALTVKFQKIVNPFRDVKDSDWYYGDVQYAVVNGLFSGTSETTFSPNTNITRAMLVTVLWRMENQPVVNYLMTFEDVETDAYYTEAVRWAASEKIVNGYSEAEFAPNDSVTREQIAAIMHRYAENKGYDVSVGENTNILSYEDFESISEFAIPAVQYAAGSGLMKGKSESTLGPKDFATRAEFAAILHRFIGSNK